MESSSVYLYYAAGGMLLYVGVTDRGVKRLHEHADSKAWWPLVTGCAIEHCKTRAEALEREQFLIKTYRPIFNFQHNPDRGLSEEAKFARAGKPLRIAVPESGIYGAMSYEERRKFHETLTGEQKRAFPCIVCGERPGHQGRPMCVPCQLAVRERRQAEARRRIALGESRKARLQSQLARPDAASPLQK